VLGWLKVPFWLVLGSEKSELLGWHLTFSVSVCMAVNFVNHVAKSSEPRGDRGYEQRENSSWMIL
jgi:hypothetical protein